MCSETKLKKPAVDACEHCNENRPVAPDGTHFEGSMCPFIEYELSKWKSIWKSIKFLNAYNSELRAIRYKNVCLNANLNVGMLWVSCGPNPFWLLVERI